jgi:NAD(P)-dependent dehydrogenase (short-subunit alcohol dehydrogenase family)
VTGRFAGRRVLVTGASRGIGAALAEQFAADGAAVAIAARTLEHHPSLPGSLRDTAERMAGHGVPVAPLVTDLADADNRASLVDRAAAALGGPVEILVNNAAAAIYHPLADFPLRRRRLTFEVNVHAPMDLIQAVLPTMLAAGEGWIVNLSSATARPFRDEGGTALPSALGVYGASKAALDRLTLALAAELAGTGVRVNTVQPRAAVWSEGLEALMADRIDPAQFEPMAAMVAATLALCDGPPELTGRVAVSLDLLAEIGQGTE